MTTALTLQNPLVKILARASDPKESREVEVMAAAARAWAKENRDYESFVQAVEVYILARRKTTELVKPYIQHGGHNQGNKQMTLLADFGFTKQQWNRRTKELEIPEASLTEYFEECVANGWHPSLAGLVRHVYKAPESKHGHEQVTTCPACGAVFQV